VSDMVILGAVRIYVMLCYIGLIYMSKFIKHIVTVVC